MILTKEQIKLLGLDLPEGSEVALDIKLPESKKWNPSPIEHGYYIETVGAVDIYVQEVSGYHPNYQSDIGNLFKERNDAISAKNDIISYLRILAWLKENDDGWVADWNNIDQKKYFINYSYYEENWNKTFVSTLKSPCVVYMSEENAIKLCDLINSGIVDLFLSED
jgi:hypothetical protein